jgi:hypothetical protein
VSVERAAHKYGRPPRAEPALFFRETASNTNERTAIAVVLPSQSAASHKLTGVLVDRVRPEQAESVLNSLSFDFALRLRSAGTNVSFTYILPVAVPPTDKVARLPVLPVLTTWEERAHVTDNPQSWPLLWKLNREVAEAYGLGPDELEHILSSFPVMLRKRPKFVAWLRQCIEGWRSETAPGTYTAATSAQVPLAADRPR